MAPVIRRTRPVLTPPPVSPQVEAAVAVVAAAARVRRIPPDRRQAPIRRSEDIPAPTARKVIPIAVAGDDEDTAPKTDYKGIIEKYSSKVNNRKSAIRAFCVQCCNGGLAEVRHCPVEKCALHPFRLGHDPFNLKSIKPAAAKGEINEEEEED